MTSSRARSAIRDLCGLGLGSVLAGALWGGVESLLGGSILPGLALGLSLGLGLGLSRQGTQPTAASVGMGALGGLALGALRGSYPGLSLGALGLCLGWAAAWGETRWLRRLEIVLAGGVAALVAGLSFDALSPLALAATVAPGWLVQGGVAGLAGATLGLGMATSHLGASRDPLLLEAQARAERLGLEQREYLEGVLQVYRGILESDPEDVLSASQSRDFGRGSAQVLRRILQLVERWEALDAFRTRFPLAALQREAEETTRRLQATEDSVARQRYQRVLESLSSRQESYEELEKGRERLVSGLEYYRATLEDLHLGLARLSYAKGSDLSHEGELLMGRLGELAGEVDDAARAAHALEGVGGLLGPA